MNNGRRKLSIGDYSKNESVAYSPDSTRFVVASNLRFGQRTELSAQVWDAKRGKLLPLSMNHYAKVNSAMYNHDGTCIVTASDDKSATVWDAKTGEQLLILKGHTARVNFAAYNHNDTRIVTSSKDGTVKEWDAKTGECLDTIQIIPGLQVMGLDLRHLHPDSKFSNENKEILRRYGAIVD